ncbi:VgrG-related protein [Cellulosimicrobium sp. Marseille-Q4280]|uniref:VgrG-related protein n=1 Tax=Cellulosimicrobium sp. Marseille-Q4280 TaxID=2937992 RepID=UPI002040BC5A|nr:VgrG-related protein [Cellulosimicrobium sp. Marseille-Q4280]
MHGEEHSARVVVRVDGRELPADVEPAVASVLVDARRDQPALFVIRLSDEHGAVLDKAGIRVGVKVELSVQLSGPGGPTPLLTGEVTSLETEIGPGGRQTTVRGFDPAHRLVGARRVATYVNVTASDVVRKVAGANGLPVGRVDATTEVFEHVWQPNISDWDLLQRLAARSGRVVGVSGGRLDFHRPAEARGAPSGTTGARQDPAVVEHGVNLISLRATVTSASQVREVEARGWDQLRKRALVARAKASTSSAQLSTTDPARLGAHFSPPPLVVPSTSFGSQGQATESARSVADRVGGGFAEIEATVLGNPAIAVGRPVAVVGCGDPFDGKYVVSGARHELSGERGYLTHVTVADASDRTTHGTVAGSRSAAGAGARGAGILPAVVTSVDDPEGVGRVKVKLPVLHDSLESWWARVVQPGAGAMRGTFVLPEVGDEVLVALAEGELDQPYVLGGLFSTTDKPPAPSTAPYVDKNSGAVTRRTITSRTGMHVEFVEKPGEERLVVSDKGGKEQVVLVQKPEAAIEITSSGPVRVTAQKAVEVTAQQDVTCTSTTGKVTVKGVQVAIEGTSAIELKAPKVSISADAQLALRGATATLDGSATAEVTSAGVTTVKGSLVKIN